MAKIPQHSEEPWKDLVCSSCNRTKLLLVVFQTTGSTTVYKIVCPLCEKVIKQIVENN